MITKVSKLNLYINFTNKTVKKHMSTKSVATSLKKQQQTNFNLEKSDFPLPQGNEIYFIPAINYNLA